MMHKFRISFVEPSLLKPLFHRSVYCLLLCLWAALSYAQSLPQPLPEGRFLTDSIEIGRPFRYAVTYHHSPAVDVLFPDTARHFAPFRVQRVDVFATKTVDTGQKAVSRDSAVYTLVSFETDSMQFLRVPVQLLNPTDCTALMTPVDTVFLRSKLAVFNVFRQNLSGPHSLTLATETKLAPLQQQLNYPVLMIGILATAALIGLFYGLFGRTIRRQWRLFQLNRRHIRFLRDYNRLSRGINAETATEMANQAVVMWKTYLEQLDNQPYASLTTPELAERMNNDRVTSALREADQMIYGGVFSAQSQSALRDLSTVATQIYHRQRIRLQGLVDQSGKGEWQPDSTEPSSVS